MLLFTVEWQFRPTGKVLTDGKVSTDAKCRYTMHSGGREEAKGQRFFLVKIFLLLP